MLIEVTSEDIKNGKDCDGARCPIALAVMRKHPKAMTVYISANGIIIYLKSKIKTYNKIPKEVALFIMKFDFYGPKYVNPFTFKLDK